MRTLQMRPHSSASLFDHSTLTKPSLKKSGSRKSNLKGKTYEKVPFKQPVWNSRIQQKNNIYSAKNLLNLRKSRSRSKNGKKQRGVASQETIKTNKSSKSAKSSHQRGYVSRTTTNEEPCNISLLPLRHHASKESLRPSRSLLKRSDSRSTGNRRSRSKSSKKRPLIEKLLDEISDRYNNQEGADSCYLNRIEKNTMIQDIKMLCTLLLTNE